MPVGCRSVHLAHSPAWGSQHQACHATPSFVSAVSGCGRGCVGGSSWFQLWHGPDASREAARHCASLMLHSRPNTQGQHVCLLSWLAQLTRAPTKVSTLQQRPTDNKNTTTTHRPGGEMVQGVKPAGLHC
jgi:hypothetical protein